ncbi:MAG: hypothetical protein Q4E46_02570 [Candidatus Saccharibacteria bacterium]|nr:hypothetical protein [Candidatus Saccharibacteria bacterium]
MRLVKFFNTDQRTINSWLSKEAASSERNYVAEIKQLKKKLDNAYCAIDKLAVEAERPKG